MATDTVSPMLADEADDVFAELEAKVNRLADALQQASAERDRALAALKPLQAAQEKSQRALAQAEQELITLRKERSEVRQRVGRLVRQLEGVGS